MAPENMFREFIALLEPSQGSGPAPFQRSGWRYCGRHILPQVPRSTTLIIEVVNKTQTCAQPEGFSELLKLLSQTQISPRPHDTQQAGLVLYSNFLR